MPENCENSPVWHSAEKEEHKRASILTLKNSDIEDLEISKKVRVCSRTVERTAVKKTTKRKPHVDFKQFLRQKGVCLHGCDGHQSKTSSVSSNAKFARPFPSPTEKFQISNFCLFSQFSGFGKIQIFVKN